MLHGRLKIEMFDEQNRKTYEQTKDNVITNLYKNVMRPNFPIDVETSQQYKLDLANYMPMAENLFGGVIILGNSKESNVDNIMITNDDFLSFRGNAGGSYAGPSKFRGTKNLTESGYFTDENGVVHYKNVWDFPSNACNGEISTICLCPTSLGDAGLEKDENDNGLTTTSLISGYGRNPINDAKISFKTRYDAHSWACNEIDNLGYLVYEEDINTHYYIKHDGTKYILTKVSRNLDLKINTTIKEDTYAPLIEYNNSFYSKEEYEVSNASKKFESYSFYNGYIYCVDVNGTFMNESTITLNVYKIGLTGGSSTTTYEYTITKDITEGSEYYITFIDNKVYITFKNKIDLLIFDLNTSTMSNVNLPISNLKANKCYDYILLFSANSMKDGVNVCYILDSNNALHYNEINIEKENSFGALERIFANDIIMNYPLGTITHKYDNIETNIQVLLPSVSSINNVSTFNKYQTNTLKLTYEIYSE